MDYCKTQGYKTDRLTSQEKDAIGKGIASNVIYLFLALLIVSGLIKTVIPTVTQAYSSGSARLASIIPYSFAKTQNMTLLPTPTPLSAVEPKIVLTEYDLIVKEINDVFGDHSYKAFALLKCENGNLDPRITSNNYDKFGNLLSTDYGIFQINNYWQKIWNEEFLFDYKINIRVAWNIYSRDGHTFKLWTCGRTLGI